VEAWPAHWEDLKTKGSLVLETQHRHKDGSIFPVEMVVNYLKYGDREFNCAFVRDISDRKEIELRLQQAQKMEAIGTLAGGIAHDFNNILGIILGYADLAKDDAAPDSKFSQDLDRVLQAGERAKGLVQQILAFSRQTKVEKVPLSPQPLISEAVKMLRSSIPTTIDIQTDICQDCGAIDADPTQLHQILMNLCTNAYHAMEETGGVLKVELKIAESLPPELVKKGKETDASFLKLSVSDTGHGIGPDIREKIFDPFFTTKGPGRGTGMGLATVYGIVADYGGAITADSQPGEGTAFHIYLPQSKQEPSVMSSQEAGIPTGEEHILFVDDEEMLLEVARSVLEKLGYQVTTEQNSVEALKMFTKHPNDFDLVITDQTMPAMTGLELARKMLRIRQIPIILCTGYSSLVDEDVARSQDIKAFVYKPLTKSNLAIMTRKVLDAS